MVKATARGAPDLMVMHRGVLVLGVSEVVVDLKEVHPGVHRNLHRWATTVDIEFIAG